MTRYIKRDGAWVLIEQGLVVVIALKGGIYRIEIYSGVSGAKLTDECRGRLDDAKDWGRGVLPFWREAG